MYKSARVDATSLLTLLERACSHKKRLKTSCTVRMYLNVWPLTKTGSLLILTRSIWWQTFKEKKLKLVSRTADLIQSCSLYKSLKLYHYKDIVMSVEWSRSFWLIEITAYDLHIASTIPQVWLFSNDSIWPTEEELYYTGIPWVLTSPKIVSITQISPSQRQDPENGLGNC